jgi:hypothetical protein
MASGYWAPLAIGTGDGPTLTAAAAATALPVSAKITFPPNSIQAGTCLRITAQGRISCVVTTPGTARFDVRLGATVVFDTGALNLNIVAKTTLPWWFDGLLVCRTSGSSGNFFGFGKWTSEAYINTAVGTTGPAPGSIISSVSGGPETAPAVGSNVDLTASNTFDFFFTQTVATGSFTVHNFLLESGSVALM